MIAKVKDGIFDWIKAVNGSSGDYNTIETMALDSNNDVVIAGIYTVAFPWWLSLPDPAGLTLGFVGKLNGQTGNEIWSRLLATFGPMPVTVQRVATSGLNTICAGVVTDDVYLNGGQITNGMSYHSIFVFRVNSAGLGQTGRGLDLGGTDDVNALHVIGNFVYLSGSTNSTSSWSLQDCNIDATDWNNGKSDSFLLKMDLPFFDCKEAIAAGSPGTDEALGLTSKDSNTLFLAGSYNGNGFNFGSGELTDYGSVKASYICEFDADLVPQQCVDFGGYGASDELDIQNAIYSSEDDLIYIGGKYKGGSMALPLSPGGTINTPVSDDFDAFIAGVNPNDLRLIWFNTHGGNVPGDQQIKHSSLGILSSETLAILSETDSNMDDGPLDICPQSHSNQGVTDVVLTTFRFWDGSSFSSSYQGSTPRGEGCNRRAGAVGGFAQLRRDQHRPGAPNRRENQRPVHRPRADKPPRIRRPVLVPALQPQQHQRKEGDDDRSAQRSPGGPRRPGYELGEGKYAPPVQPKCPAGEDHPCRNQRDSAPVPVENPKRQLPQERRRDPPQARYDHQADPCPGKLPRRNFSKTIIARRQQQVAGGQSDRGKDGSEEVSGARAFHVICQ